MMFASRIGTTERVEVDCLFRSYSRGIRSVNAVVTSRVLGSQRSKSALMSGQELAAVVSTVAREITTADKVQS
jgi:hypothetical protein